MHSSGHGLHKFVQILMIHFRSKPSESLVWSHAPIEETLGNSDILYKGDNMVDIFCLNLNWDLEIKYLDLKKNTEIFCFLKRSARFSVCFQAFGKWCHYNFCFLWCMFFICDCQCYETLLSIYCQIGRQAHRYSALFVWLTWWTRVNVFKFSKCKC